MSKQLTLRELIAVLEDIYRREVDYGGVLINCGRDVFSYRGYPPDLCIQIDTTARTSVEDLILTLRGARGWDFTGYKGGEYRMYGDTPMWLANFGSEGYRITGVKKDSDGFMYELVVE
jgi:hypothetical protein